MANIINAKLYRFNHIDRDNWLTGIYKDHLVEIHWEENVKE